MKARTIRIASYNIRKARGLDQRHDPARTLSVINSLDADIVILQEADKRLGLRPAALPRDMIATETDFEIAAIARNEVSIGWHGNAVLLKRGYRVMEIAHISLPGLEPRGAVRVEIKGRANLNLFAVHLGLRRIDRRRQLREIAAVSSSNVPTIVAGDFNAWSAKLGCGEFDRRFNVLAPGRSFHARRPIAALDRFATSARLRIWDAGVDDGALARQSSDHLPVWADISPACPDTPPPECDKPFVDLPENA